MQPDKMKWIYSFALLCITIGWAAFTMMVVNNALLYLSPKSVMEASGTSVLLGALIGWNTLVVQYWFRKKAPSGG